MFDLPLTDVDEYWCGYIRADGMINRKPRGKVLVFGQADPEPVYKLKEYLGAKNDVRFKNKISNYGQNPMYLISSAIPAYKLDNLGVKTELYEPLYKSKHFWRGLLDGDGSVVWVKNGGKEYPCICWSGSEIDMTMLQTWINETFGYIFKVGRTRSIFRLGMNGKKAKEIALYLYEGEYSAFSRKSDTALSFK